MAQKIEIQNVYPLTPMQEGMLFHTMLDGKTGTYIQQLQMKITGFIDIEQFRNNFQLVVSRHGALRTVFKYTNVEKPLQAVLKSVKARMVEERIDQLGVEEQEVYIRAYRERERAEGFDPTKEIPLRLTILATGEASYTILLSFHHVILDGWSLAIVLKDLFAGYLALRGGVTAPQAPAALAYGEYVRWLSQQDRTLSAAYWSQALEGYEPASGLPKMRTGQAAGEQRQFEFRFDEQQTAGLSSLATTYGLTLSAVFQTLWGILLQRYSGTQDIVFGSVVSGRPAELPGIEQAVGLFIHTIPVRVQVQAEETFAELAQRVYRASLEVSGHEAYPLYDLQSRGGGELFDHVVAFENYPFDREGLSGGAEAEFEITGHDWFEQTNYDFHLIVLPGKELGVGCFYRSDVFEDAMIRQLEPHLKRLVEAVVNQPACKVEDLDPLTEEEQVKLLTGWNQADVSYPKAATLTSLFEAQTERTPERTAVVCGEERLTYEELNRRANRLARRLRREGVGPDTLVGLLLGRTSEMIVAMLGVLKAGGAYVPIDPAYPQERIAFMLRDSGARVLIAGDGLEPDRSELPNYAARVISVHDNEEELEETNLAAAHGPEQLAYIIYTSGTTGTPKGVMIEHHNVVRLLVNDQLPYTFGTEDVWTVFHSFCFDFSVWEMYGALLYGGTCVIVPKETAQSPEAFLGLLESERVTVLNQTPTAFYALVQEAMAAPDKRDLALRYIIFGGEALQPIQLRSWKRAYPQTKLINMYGITETTVHVTYKEITEAEMEANLSNIGRPIPTLRCYVLDSRRRLVPTGAMGELYVGGDGVARGYLGREELTAERFVANPYDPQERLYKSGDLVRLLPGGELAYIGRIDHQVKIRGHRIETGEIEHRLLLHPQVKEAMVLAVERGIEKELCAYVVQNGELSSGELRVHIEQELPAYMVPAYFMMLEQMPRTANGKTDRQALPEPKAESEAAYQAPRNSKEVKLAELFQEVLGVERVGIHDHFFELGGHSLKAMQLVSKVQQHLGERISLQQMFAAPTVSQLAVLLSGESQTEEIGIPRAEERSAYPVSSAQLRMLLADQLEGSGVSYNIPIALIAEGLLDPDRVAMAFQQLIERHEALRTSFHYINEEWVQQIHSSYELEVPLSRGEKDQLNQLIASRVRPFDLSCLPLVRVELVELGDNRHLLFLDIHHIISDGVSVGLLVKEFAALYEGQRLDAPKVQYKDFAVWQQERLSSELLLKQEDYWLRELGGELPVLQLPTDRPRPAMQSFTGGQWTFDLREDGYKQLKRLSQEGGATLYMALISVYSAVLANFAGQEELLLGTGLAGRTHSDLDNTLGMFVNMLVLYSRPKLNKTFRELLKEMKETSTAGFENQEYPFDLLQQRLDLQRDPSRNPLFDAAFVLQNMEILELQLPGVKFTSYDYGNPISKFDLTLYAWERGEGLRFNLEYSSALFDQTTIEQLGNRFVHMVHEVTKHPDMQLGQLDLLTTEERSLLRSFNETKRDYRVHTVTELFARQAARTPNLVAVECRQDRITFQELDEKSGHLALKLKSHGVEAGQVVAIMTEHSTDLAVGLMGIMKAGGVFLPIDPDDPEERVRYLLEDSGANLLLTHQEWIERVSFATNVLLINDLAEIHADETATVTFPAPADLAYIIYTSGTTGKPKGVCIEHQAISNTLNWRVEDYRLGEEHIVLPLVNFTFDAFVGSFFTALVSGSKVVLMDRTEAKDPAAVRTVITSKAVTHLVCVPALYLALLQEVTPQDVSSLQAVTLGGSELTDAIVKKSKQINPDVELINEYGPSENSVVTTALRHAEKADRITIGSPIANTNVYIMSDCNDLQPVGIVGELCITGAGLARGYLNRPELTAEKFVAHPSEPTERLYRTGDRARWLANGSIEYMGRIDNQVKIRGFRIETSEVESKLLQLGDLREALVVAVSNDNGEKELCAYFVSEQAYDSALLRAYLLASLPSYMVPSYFMQLKEIPLTSNGKPDRKALPQPNTENRSSQAYIAPQNQLQEELVEIWQELLGVDQVGIRDHFFELGGHSLKAASLASKIQKHLKLKVTLRDVFMYPTIEKLVAELSKQETTVYADITPIRDDRKEFAVSSAQKRLFILHQMEGAELSYNMPSVLRLGGSIDTDRLEWAFEQLIARHESLRTSFDWIEGEAVQQVRDQVELNIEYAEAREDQVQEAIAAFVRPFDLGQAPLMRVRIVSIDEDHRLLMFDMHHIISDGTSIQVLISEFARLYAGEILPELRLQYKDYSEWQHSLRGNKEYALHESYWSSLLNGELPVLALPTDYTRPQIQKFDGSRISFVIDKELTKSLNKVCIETDSTLYMVMLAVFGLLLNKYSGQQDLIIGSPIAGRPHEDMEPIIGMFANTLAMRMQPEGGKSFFSYLQEVKQSALEAFEHQDYPFEDLVEVLHAKRDVSRNPIFDVMFALQNMELQELAFGGMQLKPYDFEYPVSKFDLTLYATPEHEDISCVFEYSTALYKRETVEQWARHYLMLLKEVVSAKDKTLSQLQMLDAEERQMLLKQSRQALTTSPQAATVHQWFEEQAAKTPDHTAVVFEDSRLTYKELNSWANRLAKELRSRGATADSVIGMLMDRSLEMVASILGILKAGAAFVPIDPEYPEERIRTIMTESNPQLFISTSRVLARYPFLPEGILVDTLGLGEGDDENPAHINRSSDLLYVIYTSGTTGKPKGVMLEHQNLINLLDYQFTFTAIDFSGKVLQYTTCSFDVCYQEIFSTLLAGGELHLISTETKQNVPKLLAYIAAEQIPVLFFPVSLLKYIFQDNEEAGRVPGCVRDIITAGEQLVVSPALKAYLKAYKVRLHNHYGPSETHVVTTLMIDPDSDIEDLPSIGRPIANTSIYLLNEALDLQPPGVVGELYIAGDSVGRGYYGNEALTVEKFIDDPFVPEGVMYRTGDLACWLPDGTIKFLGRADHQVKIRGHRVELGEVEALLLSHNSVQEVAVIALTDENGVTDICAYHVCLEPIDPAQLRAYAAKTLPEYMVPSYFIPLERLPITPNGKLDRRALPTPQAYLHSGTVYREPQNETETALVALYQEVLGVSKVGATDHFFHMGGHSLKAMTLISRIRKFMGVELSLSDLFQHPTVEALAERIQTLGVAAYSAIELAEQREFYPVTTSQKRLMILEEVAGGELSYNMPAAFVLEGELDIDRFEDALRTLIDRHDILRTSFELVDGTMMQRIHSGVDFRLERGSALEEEAPRLAAAFVRKFELSQARLLRAAVIDLAKNRRLFLLDMHHIITDGMSIDIFILELSALYERKDLPVLRLQYRDFAVWQQNWLQSSEYEAQEAYWQNALSGEISPLQLPTDFSRPVMQSFNGSNLSFHIHRETVEQLRDLAQSSGATLYMVLLAAYSVLLYRCSGQNDIVVGTPISGRTHADMESMLGMFVNTLAIRSNPAGDLRFAAYLEEVKRKVLEAFDHADYPFEALVEKLQVNRDLSRNPIFDTLFVLQNPNASQPKLGVLDVMPLDFVHPVSKFDLSLFAVESADGGIQFTLEYATALFKRESIERWAEYYQELLIAIVKKPQTPLSELTMMNPRHIQGLAAWNRTETDFAKEMTIHRLFEQQVQLTPDRTAIEFGDMQLTYHELNERANRLARRLRAIGVDHDKIVGLLMERSIDMIVAIFAVLKAGGAYLPISPEFPEERINYLLEDSRSELVVTHFDWAGLCTGVKTLLLDGVDYASEDGSNLEAEDPSALAYVIYTSGSTGRPKGVLIEHRNAVNLLLALQDQYPVHANDCSMLKAAFTFDLSVAELFGWFHEGGKLVILAPGYEKEPKEIIAAIHKHGVTHINFVPSMLRVFLEVLSEEERAVLQSLKYMMAAGEALSFELVQMFNELVPGVQLLNGYGPTETTVYTTTYKLTQNQIGTYAPIGKPLANVRTYVVDSSHKPQLIGSAGELCISGAGLARGFLNNPELTAERFVANPFEPGERMYKTGDLVRQLGDGTLEYLGRIDFQVKIRGYRIELGEIEARLLALDGVKEAVVIAREESLGEAYLCVYYISESAWSREDLRIHLSGVLPAYMVPSYYVQMQEMPLTTSGKLDRKALPVPDRTHSTHAEYEKPNEGMEEQVAGIWAEVLRLDQVGALDHFFELGGDSLKAITLLQHMHQRLGLQASIRDLFQYPTVRLFTEAMSSRSSAQYQVIKPAEEREVYPLSSAQNRLYFMQQFEGEGEGRTHNMPAALYVEGELDRVRFIQAFEALVARHESLRTSFELVDGIPMQRIAESVSLVLEEKRAATLEDALSVHEVFVRQFDLSQAPLLRVCLIEIDEGGHLLLFDMHHIISDGVSMAHLTKEFALLYRQEQLPPLRIQYKDFAVWQETFFQTDAFKQQETYWLEALSGELPQLQLSADYSRPPVRDASGDRIFFTLDEHLMNGVQRLAKETGSTVYMVLLAVFTVLLSKLSGQEDIIIGSLQAGRTHSDLDPIMGMFVNNLVMRNRVDAELSFQAYCNDVKRTVLEALEHPDYPFERLVDKLKVSRDLSRNPIFDAMFTLQNMEKQTLSAGEVHLTECDYYHPVAKYDLSLYASEEPGHLSCMLEYATALFKRETIERWAEYYRELVRSIVSEPQTSISNLRMISTSERELLTAWNQTESSYPSGRTFHELFEAQVCLNPDQPAIYAEEGMLTYSQLNERANRLARTLRDKGVRPDSIIAVMVERSLDMMVGIYAVLKAGGAYLPIDPTSPADRIVYMLEDSQAQLLLTLPGYVESVENFSALETLMLDDDRLFHTDGSNLVTICGPRSLAYTIYTSGSTGRPKGVMIEHESMINRINWTQKMYPLGQDDIIMQKTPYTFDVSVCELFWWSIAGASVYLLPPGGEKDLALLIGAVRKRGITYMHFVPSMMQAFLEYVSAFKCIAELTSLRWVFASGEALPLQHVTLFNQLLYTANGTRLVNLYGPTEATVDVTSFICSPGEALDRVPIGKPIDNIRLHIVDKQWKEVPVGVIGELCIAGVGVARGYLNKPELTAEKFVANPFEPGTIMYRTGDLARWLTDGNIEYAGRIDYQVKIRGYRIELGEIEARLLELEGMKEAVVLAREEAPGEFYLCAYYTASLDGEWGSVALKAELSQKLPSYMVPVYFIEMEKMPLTGSGKLDRKALPQPDRSQEMEMSYVAPKEGMEELVADIWMEVLGVEKVSAQGHFFDLGGDSIKALQILSRLRNKGYVATIKQLFQHPTVSEFASCIRKVAFEIPQDPVIGAGQLNPIQRRYVEPPFSPELHFNQAFMLYRKEGYDEQWVRNIFRRLLEHHDALRIRLKSEDDQWVLDNQDAEVDRFELEWFDYSGETDIEKRIAEAELRIQSGIHPVKGPLVKLGIFHTQDGDHLLIAIHHMVVDGVSWRILLEDFATAFNQLSMGQDMLLPPKTHSYLTYTAQLQQYAQDSKIHKELAYWVEVSQSEVTSLPKDSQVERRLNKHVQSLECVLPVKETEQLLKQVHQAYGTNTADILLAALGLGLRDWGGIQKSLIFMEGHGREPFSDELDISRTVGWFTSLYPFLLEIGDRSESEDNTLSQTIKSVKDKQRSIPNNGFGYGVLRYLSTESELLEHLSQQTEICFNYLGQADQDIKRDVFDVSPFGTQAMIHPERERHYALDISGIVIGGELRIQISHDENEYRKETIERLLADFKYYLLAIIAHCAFKEITEKTLSDFTDQELTNDELDQIGNLLMNL